MTSRTVLTLAAVLTLASLVSVARAQDPRLALIRDDAMRDMVRRQVDLASNDGLPADPFLSKALEGVAKKASTKSIRKAMDALQRRMRRASDLLAPSPTIDELAAGADAIGVGAPERTLKQMRAAAPGRSIALELGVLTELVAKGVPPKQASKMVLDLMARGATGAQLTTLSGAVQEDVAAGLKPDAALELRGRGVMSLLPPPPSVQNAAPRGRP